MFKSRACYTNIRIGLNGIGTGPEQPTFTDGFAGANGTYTVEQTTVGVPEPATFGLLSLGLAGLGFARCKRKS